MGAGKLAGLASLLVLLIGIQILRRIWRGRSDIEVNLRWTATQFGILLLISLTNIARLPPVHQPDVAAYQNYSTQILEGKVPYLDFDVSYPPLALIPMLAAQVFSPGSRTNLAAYAAGFGIVIALLSTGVALVLWRIALRPHLGYAKGAPYSYILLVVIMTPLMSWRFDLFPAFLTQLAFLAVLRGQPLAAGLGLGAGAAAKLYPLLLLPVFAVFYMAKKESSSIARLALGAGLAGGVLVLPFWLRAPEGFLNFLTYHQHRSLELGSLAAGLITLGHILGLTEISLVENFGATHLVAPVANSVRQALPFVFAIAFFLLLVMGFRRFRQEALVIGEVSDESLLNLLVVVLLTCLATSTILSPQYILWLFPFAPLLRREAWRAYLLIAALTSVIFPFLWSYIRNFELMPVLVLNARNLLMAGLAIWLVMTSLRASQVTGRPA